MNLYGFCGNDGVNRWDYLGQSFFSKLWKKIKPYVAIAAAVAVTVVTYGAASGAAFTVATAATATSAGSAATGILASSVIAGAISASTAGVLAAGIGGAAAGFTAGLTGSLINGASASDAIKSAAIGGIVGGITAGLGQYLSGVSNVDPYVARFSTGALRGGIETGDIGGVIRGGLVNLAPTDLRLGYIYKNNMAVNLAANIIRNAGQGYVINGEEGMRRSVFGSLANNLVGHGLGLISSGFEKPTFKDGMYFYPSKTSVGNWLTENVYDAITFGNVVNTTQSVIQAGYGINPYPDRYSYQGNEHASYENPKRLNWIYSHEIDHFKSQDILGPYYIPLNAISQGAGSASAAVGSNAGYFLEQKPFKLLPYGK